MVKENEKIFEATVTFSKGKYKNARLIIPKPFWEENKLLDKDVIALELKGVKRLKEVKNEI